MIGAAPGASLLIAFGRFTPPPIIICFAPARPCSSLLPDAGLSSLVSPHLRLLPAHAHPEARPSPANAC